MGPEEVVDEAGELEPAAVDPVSNTYRYVRLRYDYVLLGISYGWAAGPGMIALNPAGRSGATCLRARLALF